MRKIYILYMATISILSLVYINNTSALDYSSNVGIGFTFNPTLSVNISPSDLTISNLSPGTTADSNIINVSVATNATYGYTLSANVNNESLVHSNNINTFNSIATDADLSDLEDSEDTNIWGYSTSLDSGSTWSNYNGLSNSSNTTLLDKDSNISSSIDFRIGAKASPVQPSGTYTNTITFTAVTKPTPITLSEAYASEGKTMVNGYYTMQDMTSTICEKTEAIGAQLQVLDIRDNKLYWISKLADNHCWMTQNLDLDLSHDKPLTSEDTDLNDSSLSGAYAENYTYNPENKLITWIPEKTTKVYGKDIGDKWANDNHQSNSMDIGQWYWNGNDDTPDCNFLTTKCNDFSQTSDNKHLSVGNYYNWPAAIASDNSSSLTQSTYTNITNNPQNSICPKNWRLPTISNQGAILNSTSEFARLNSVYTNSSNGDLIMISAPLYFVRSGHNVGSLYNAGVRGFYWSSTVGSANISAYFLNFIKNSVSPATDFNYDYRAGGRSIRCLAR